MSGAAHGNNRQLNAIKANEYTFIFRTGTARLMFTFTRSGDLVTTSEYQGALVKRVGMQISRDEVKEFADFIASNLKVEPYPMKADALDKEHFCGPPCHPDGFWAAEVTGLTPGRAVCSVCGLSPQLANK